METNLLCLLEKCFRRSKTPLNSYISRVEKVLISIIIFSCACQPLPNMPRTLHDYIQFESVVEKNFLKLLPVCPTAAFPIEYQSMLIQAFQWSRWDPSYLTEIWMNHAEKIQKLIWPASVLCFVPVDQCIFLISNSHPTIEKSSIAITSNLYTLSIVVCILHHKALLSLHVIYAFKYI